MKKVYKIREVGIGAFIGGPLAAGYMLFKNYKTFGKDQLAKRTVWITLLSSVLILGAIILVTFEDTFPSYLLPIIFLGISRLLTELYQKSDIEAFLLDGGEAYSIWRAIAVGIISSVIIMFIATLTPVVYFINLF